MFLKLSMMAMILLLTICKVFFPIEKDIFNETQIQIEQLQNIINFTNEIKNKKNKIKLIIEEYKPKIVDTLKQSITDEIYDATIKYTNLDIELICSLIIQESGFDHVAVSSMNAIGIMQILPSTGKDLVKYENLKWNLKLLYNPVINIRLGTRYLSYMIDMYGLHGGLAAYNGGFRVASAWIKNKMHLIPVETKSYVPNIIRIYQEYKI